MSIMCAMPNRPEPKRFVTQTLPWLSMLSPLLLERTSIFTALVGSDAGKRMTWKRAVRDPDAVLLVDRQVEWRSERFAGFGAVAFADDAAFLPVALGEMEQLPLGDASAHTSPLGAVMMPCIKPRRPPKLMPSGGVSGLPSLSNTVMDLLP